MEFDLEDFVTNPTIDKLFKCKKAELIVIANSFDVQVPPSAKKGELRELLCQTLQERAAFKLDPTGVVELGDMTSIPTPSHDLPVRTGMTEEELALTLCIKEVEARHQELEVEAMCLKVKALELEWGAASTSSHTTSHTPMPTPQDSFDFSRHITLLPPFRESEVDSYFSAFEHIAATLRWPKNVWPLLLQCKFIRKAQEVCVSLSTEDSLEYEIVKSTVLLRAYQLVPEAYRQKFRKSEKNANLTYVEFEKSALFDKWCQANKVTTLDNLRDLVLLEEFKNRPDTGAKVTLLPIVQS